MSAFVKTRTRAAAVDAARFDQHVLDLAAVGAGVHPQRAADRAGNAAQEGEAVDAGGRRRLGDEGVGRGGAGGDATIRQSTSIALKARPPSRTTTPATPPSRTIRFEPRPMTVTGIVARQAAEEAREVVLVGRREQGFAPAPPTRNQVKGASGAPIGHAPARRPRRPTGSRPQSSSRQAPRASRRGCARPAAAVAAPRRSASARRARGSIPALPSSPVWPTSQVSIRLGSAST